jgi:hypothetical protein
MSKFNKALVLAGFLLAFSIAFADEVNVTVNVTRPEVQIGYAIMKSLVGFGMGIGFIGGVLTLLFGIDFFKTKNPLVSIVLVLIGIAVILIIFIYLWGTL